MEKEGGFSYVGFTSSVVAYRRSPGLAVAKNPSSALMNVLSGTMFSFAVQVSRP